MNLLKCCLLFIFFTAIPFLSWSQRIEQEKGKTKIELISPPNGIHLYDNIFIDEIEICNLHWLEYLYYLKEDSSEQFYLSQLPDSSAWQAALQPKDSIDPYIYYYFRYPAFRYYPVIGISYEQAKEYCKWRANVVNDSYQKETFLKKYPKLKNYDIRVEYRLPTKEEWEYAAGGGLPVESFAHGIERPTHKKRYKVKLDKKLEECLSRNNIEISTKTNIHRVEFTVAEDYYTDLHKTFKCYPDTTLRIKYIYENIPNGFGIFNMIGNVAEMTLTKGVAKGGSFKHFLSDFDIRTDFLYNKPEEWLSFRCLAVVHMRRKVKGKKAE